MSSRRDAEYCEYVTARLSSLRRLAAVLCGDWQHADDLVQAALTKLYVHWGRVRAADHDLVLDLRTAVAALPARQRATLVLRFYCDLNVEQCAAVLGCSPGTVKSQTARALEAVRRALGPGHDAGPGEPASHAFGTTTSTGSDGRD